MKTMRVAYAAVVNYISTLKFNPNDSFKELPRRSYGSTHSFELHSKNTHEKDLNPKPIDDLRDIDPELLAYDLAQSAPTWKKMIHSLCAVSYLLVTFTPTFSFATRTVTEEEILSQQPKPINQGFDSNSKPLFLNVKFNIQSQEDGSVRLSYVDNLNANSPLNEFSLIKGHLPTPQETLQSHAFSNLFDTNGQVLGFKYRIQGLGIFQYSWEKNAATFDFLSTDHPLLNITFKGPRNLNLKNGHIKSLSHSATVLFLSGTMGVENIENSSPGSSEKLIVGTEAFVNGQLLGQEYQNIHIHGEAKLTNFVQKEGVLHVNKKAQVLFKGDSFAQKIINEGDVGFDVRTFQGLILENKSRVFMQSGITFIGDIINSPESQVIFENHFLICPEKAGNIKAFDQYQFKNWFTFGKISPSNLMAHTHLTVVLGDFWKNFKVQGNLNLYEAVNLKSLNDLKDLVVTGRLKVFFDNLYQSGNLKLPNIHHLEIHGSSGTFRGDLELPALTMRMKNNVTFGWVHDPNFPSAKVYKESKMASLTLTQGDLDIQCGNFDGRWGKIAGLRGKGLIRTLIGDILLGDGKECWGNEHTKTDEGIVIRDGKEEVESYPLGQLLCIIPPYPLKGKSCKYWDKNGSLFSFPQKVDLQSAGRILLKGAEVKSRDFILMEGKKEIDLLYSHLEGYRGGILKSKEGVKFHREEPYVSRDRYGTLAAVTSNPTHLIFGDTLEVETPHFSSTASVVETGGSFILNQEDYKKSTIISPEYFYTIYVFNSPIIVNRIQNKFRIGEKMLFKMHGMQFSMDASAQAIFAKGTDMDILNVGKLQTLRDRTRNHHVVLNQLVEESPRTYGLKALPKGTYGPQEINVYENMLPGSRGFHPDPSRTFFMASSGSLPFHSYINPLKNGDMDMLVMRVLGAYLGKNFLEDTTSGTFIAGRYILPYLSENGRRFEKAVFKEFKRQPTLEEIEKSPIPMIWFQGNGQVLETHLHIPGALGSKYLTGSWEANTLAFDLSGRYNQTDTMLHTLYDSLVKAKGDVTIQATPKRIGSNGNFTDVRAANSGSSSERGPVAIVSDETLRATGATFDTHTPGLLQGAKVFLDPLSLVKHSEYTKKRKKKRVTVISEGVTYEGTVVKGQSQFTIVATKGDIQSTASAFKIPKIKFVSPMGTTALFSAMEQWVRLVSWSKKNAWRIKMGGHQESGSSAHSNTFAPGTAFDFDDVANVYVQHRAGEVCPELVEALKNHESLFFEPVEDTYNYKQFKTKRVVNPVMMQIIGAALSIVTAGSSLGATTAASITSNTVLQAAIQKGINFMMNKLILSFIANECDLGKTFKQTFSTDTFKTLGTVMFSAGFMQGMAEHFEMRLDAGPKDAALTIGERAQRASLQFMGDTIGESTIGGKSFKKAVVNNARSGAGDFAQEVAASKIGTASKDGKIDQATRYGAHAVAGGLASSMRGKDWRAGALGAVVAEVSGDVVRSQMESHGFLNPESDTFGRDKAIGVEISKFFTTSVACAFNLDADEAARSAGIAARENAFESLHQNQSAELKLAAENTPAGKVDKTINDIAEAAQFGAHDPEKPFYQEIYEAGPKAYAEKRIREREELNGRPLTKDEAFWCRKEATLKYNVIAHHLAPSVIGTQVRRLTNFLGLDTPLKATKTWVGNMVDAPFTIMEKVAVMAGAPEAETRAYRLLGEKATGVALFFLPNRYIPGVGTITSAIPKTFRFGAAAETQLANGYAKMDSLAAAKAGSQAATQLTHEQAKMLNGLDLAGTHPTKMRQVVDSSSFGPNSKITPLERPGFVKFDNVEFRAVRDLGHMSTDRLLKMYKNGLNPRDVAGEKLVGHHFKQIDHRSADGFLVEIPQKAHKISNPIQHPKGNGKGAGLTESQRKDWNKTRKEFNKERAKQELIRRGKWHE